jgi:2-polyprenyl-3-methyl-5-hydroxy-6-metoxy-1,4-benzoquinol methylase
MSKKPGYIYLDDNDNITDVLMTGSDTKDWQKEDDEVNDLALGHIKKCVTEEHPILLDAGCGTGRLLPTFAPHFPRVVALEPDLQRFEEAKTNLMRLGLGEKVDLENVSVEEFGPSKKIHVILFNHVLQHVGCDHIDGIMRKFRDIQNAGGLLLLSTCHSCKSVDYFTKAFVVDSRHAEEEISREEFDSLTVSRQQGVLPSHFFSKTSLETLLTRFSYEVVEFRPYHNSVAKDGCRDVFVAAVKKSLEKP